MVIRAENVRRRYGETVALDGVSFSVERGEVFALIGPNGAGKTTLINLLAGIYAPTEGQILFNGEDISAMAAHRRAVLGIGRTFQLIHPLEDLTLLENVMTGFLFARKQSLRRGREEARTLCKSLGLTGLDRSTGELNILETKKMEIAKALAGGPSVVFLDEVMAGLNSDETMDIIRTVRKVAAEQNLGIGVVEHVMGVIKELTERVVVLDAGAVIAAGPYAEVSKDERVISAYLGGGA